MLLKFGIEVYVSVWVHRGALEVFPTSGICGGSLLFGGFLVDSLSLGALSLETGEIIFLSNIYAPSDVPGKSLLWSHIIFLRLLDPFLS